MQIQWRIARHIRLRLNICSHIICLRSMDGSHPTAGNGGSRSRWRLGQIRRVHSNCSSGERPPTPFCERHGFGAAAKLCEKHRCLSSVLTCEPARKYFSNSALAKLSRVHIKDAYRACSVCGVPHLWRRLSPPSCVVFGTAKKPLGSCWPKLPKEIGAAGYRSQCLNVANVALYHVSYSPLFMEAVDRSAFNYQICIIIRARRR